MKVITFQANKGDCLLLSGDDGTTILVDGGLKGSFRQHTAPTLQDMAEANQGIDLVYVSHFDEDHIAGILALMDDIVDWRVYDHQITSGNSVFPQPKSGQRPPQIRALWHNAFQDQVALNVGELEALLILNMKTMLVAEELLPQAEAFQNLVTSEKQALLLSHRVSAQQLNIPVNQPANGSLLFVQDDQKKQIPLGDMTIDLIGPFAADIEKLREEWNNWVEHNQKTIREVRYQAEREAERLRLDEGKMLQASLSALANALGDRKSVTPPNLASIMLLAEEAGKTVLLTGDGHGEDILRGLRLYGRIDNDKGAHLNILKVQHHGSEFNLDEEFCRWVTADHYIFCGNGAHENPHLGVIEAIIESRLGPAAAESKNAQVNEPFKLWFNSSGTADNTPKRKEHMEKVEALVRERASESNGWMTFHFLASESSFEIDLSG